MVTSLLTDRRLRSWLSGAVLTWSWTRSKQWRWSWTSGENPQLSPIHHHEQHCDCSGVIQVPGHHHLPGPEVEQSHRLLRQLRKFILPQELLIKFYSAIIESVLCTSITVWFSSATKSDLRRLRRVPSKSLVQPSPLSRNCTYPEWAKGLQNLSEPLTFTSSTLPLWTVVVWSMLQSTRMTRHRNSFFPQAIHLTNTWQ